MEKEDDEEKNDLRMWGDRLVPVYTHITRHWLNNEGMHTGIHLFFLYIHSLHELLFSTSNVPGHTYRFIKTCVEMKQTPGV